MLGTFPKWIIAIIDEWRPDNKGWGPITIRAELKRLDRAKGIDLPCVKSISSYLRSKNRNRPYRDSALLPDTKMEIGQYPHHVWQMDAEGNKSVETFGHVAFINIKDTFTKIYAQSLPIRCRTVKAHAKRSDYQLALRLAWVEFGICTCLQLDHESIYYDNVHLSPYPTKMHLWLIGMGVNIVFTPKGKPHRQGAVERCHQTLDSQICHHNGCQDWPSFLNHAAQRRRALNQYIPSRALEGQAPLQACPEDEHRSNRLYQLDQELEIFDEQRIINYLVSCKPWQRKVNGNCCVQIGSIIYYLNGSVPNQELNIKVNRDRQIEFRLPNSEEVVWKKPLKGYRHQLVGESLKNHQKWAKLNPLFVENEKLQKGHD